jgi:hypothetical protein
VILTRFKLLSISLVLLLLACLGYLTVDNVLQKRNQKSLLSQIEVTRQRLAVVSPGEDNLSQKFSQAKSENQKAQALAAATPPGSTEVINILVKLASQHNLAISPINTESWKIQSMGSVNYKMLPISLEIQGSLSNLIAFVQKLGDTNLYPYLIIQGLTMDDQLAPADSSAAVTEVSVELELALIQRNPSQAQGDSQ